MKLQVRPQIFYLVFSLAVALPLIFVTRPGGVPDEGNHLTRSFQIAQGDVVGKNLGGTPGGLLPSELAFFFGIPVREGSRVPWSSIRAAVFDTKPVDWSKVTYEHLSATVQYSPISYFPQVLAVFVGKALHLGVYPISYLARLMNVLVGVLLTFWAINTLPRKKWALTMIALAPTNIFLLASVSPDTVTSALAFCVVAVACRSYVSSLPLERKELLLMFVLAGLMTLAKASYLTLPFLFVLFSRHRFVTKKDWIRFSLALIGWIVCLQLWWAYSVRDLHVPMFGYSREAQIAYLERYPLRIFEIAFRTFVDHSGYIIHQWAAIFGWNDIFVPKFVSTSFFIGTLIAWTGFRNENFDFSWKQRILLWSLAWGAIFIFSLGAYLTWTPYRSPSVIALQGRYFIPVAPLLLLAISGRNRWQMKNEYQGAFVAVFVSWGVLEMYTAIIKATYL